MQGFAPTCQGSATKGAEPSPRMPGGQVLPYCVAFTWPPLPACPRLRREGRSIGGNWNREDLSVAHLQMINLSYVADKGELSGFSAVLFAFWKLKSSSLNELVNRKDFLWFKGPFVTFRETCPSPVSFLCKIACLCERIWSKIVKFNFLAKTQHHLHFVRWHRVTKPASTVNKISVHLKMYIFFE